MTELKVSVMFLPAHSLALHPQYTAAKAITPMTTTPIHPVATRKRKHDEFVGSCPTNNAPHTLFIRIFGFVARSSRVNGNGDTPSAF